MIKISGHTKKFVNEYKEKIKNEIENELKENNEKYGKLQERLVEKLDIILIGNINNIIRVYNKLHEEFPAYVVELGAKEVSVEQEKFNKYIKEIFNYNTIIAKDKNFAYSITSDLKVTVCPYCNRQRIDTVEEITRPQLDHFFYKAKYPILSLSLYNLIPSCSNCNNKKRDNDFNIKDYLYPFKSGINNEKYFTARMTENKKYILDIVCGKSNNMKKMKNNSEILGIEKIYKKAHNEDVQRIYDIKEIYTKSYQKEISELLKDNIKEEDLRKVLGFSKSDKLESTELGKLKKDIIDEIINY